MQIALDINTDIENFWWTNCGGNAFLNAACLGMFQLQCWREKHEADVATWPGADFFSTGIKPYSFTPSMEWFLERMPAKINCCSLCPLF